MFISFRVRSGTPMLKARRNSMNLTTAVDVTSNYKSPMNTPVNNDAKRSVNAAPDATPGCPLALLMGEHEQALQELNKMAVAAKSIQTSGFSAEAFQQIADAIRYIGSVVRKHNEKEEQFLFPKMDRHINGYQSLMRHEHRELWGAFNELLKSV